jgi:hypothetical protein
MFVLPCVWVIVDRVLISNLFIDHLLIVATSNYNIIAKIHTLHTAAHASTSRFPVTDLNNAHSPGSHYCPANIPQLHCWSS